VPDFNSYYYTEDIPYGLAVIKGIAEVVGVSTPMADRIIRWGEKILGKQYMDGDRLAGPDAIELPIPRNFGITTVEELVRRSE
jgi:opine dehydrogenase